MEKKVILVLGIVLSIIILASFVYASQTETESSNTYIGVNYDTNPVINQLYEEYNGLKTQLHNLVDESVASNKFSKDMEKLYDEYWTKEGEYMEMMVDYTRISEAGEPCFDNCDATTTGIPHTRCYDVCFVKRNKILFDDDSRILNLQIQLAKDTLDKMNEMLGKEQTTNTGKQQNTNQGSNSFNTNSDRGRDEFGRMNPSFGGYLGDAYVVRSDGTKVIPGKELYLKVEDKLTTGKNSNLNLIFKDVGGINLGPNTELRVGNALLDQYYLARGSLKTQLNWGTLPPQKIEFHTPNAKISVKGTEFVIDHNETTNITTIYLNKGVLEISIQDEIINFTAGNYLIIYPNGESWEYSLKPKNWDYLGNNFYEIPDVDKKFNYIVLIIDLIFIFLLTLWMKKKIKNPDKNDKSTSKGTGSLVSGIFGIILLMVPYIGIIFSAIAFCLSKIQKSIKPTGLATAGFVLGIIGMILNAIFLILAL